MHLATRIRDLAHSPIGAAHALVPQRTDPRPLLDLSQAAPSFPPAPAVAAAVAEAATDPAASRYAPQPGLPALRDAFADDLRAAYGAPVTAEHVLITAGCNQAFCLVASALAEPGDEVLVVEPFYFNHDMWLRAEGVGVRYVMTGADCVPDPGRVASMIGDRTRAVVVVTPGNPTGVTIPPAVIRAVADVARRHEIALIIDETYRTHRATSEAPHHLFAEDGWTETVVSLHSFSKDLAIPGYRVGAIVGGRPILVEALKLLDCVAISASNIGQRAAIAGLTSASSWRRDQVELVARRQARFTSVLSDRPGGFELVTAGAYFGWVRHPFEAEPTESVVRRLVLEHGVLVIPGTAFTADDRRFLRFSFPNLEADEIDELPSRLGEVLPL